jgi:hypothetical protein
MSNNKAPKQIADEPLSQQFPRGKQRQLTVTCVFGASQNLFSYETKRVACALGRQILFKKEPDLYSKLIYTYLFKKICQM